MPMKVHIFDFVILAFPSTGSGQAPPQSPQVRQTIAFAIFTGL